MEEFHILLKEENNPLFLGKKSQSFWDNKQFSVGYGTLSFEGETINEPEARRRALKHFLLSRSQASSLLTGQTWEGLSPKRKGVLTRMVYQLGLKGTKGFKKFLLAIKEGDFNKAADEMLDSKWAREDTPIRAANEASIMRGR